MARIIALGVQAALEQIEFSGRGTVSTGLRAVASPTGDFFFQKVNLTDPVTADGQIIKSVSLGEFGQLREHQSYTPPVARYDATSGRFYAEVTADDQALTYDQAGTYSIYTALPGGQVTIMAEMTGPIILNWSFAALAIVSGRLLPYDEIKVAQALKARTSDMAAVEYSFFPLMHHDWRDTGIWDDTATWED